MGLHDFALDCIEQRNHHGDGDSSDNDNNSDNNDSGNGNNSGGTIRAMEIYLNLLKSFLEYNNNNNNNNNIKSKKDVVGILNPRRTVGLTCLSSLCASSIIRCDDNNTTTNNKNTKNNK